MKRRLLLLAAVLMALLAAVGCSPRTLPQQEEPAQPPAVSEEQPEISEKPAVPPAPAPVVPQTEEPESQPVEEPEKEEADAQKEEEPSNAESSPYGQSGTFKLLGSGYEITLPEPFLGIEDLSMGGFYISVRDDASLQGIVSYEQGKEAVKAIEANISGLNDALKNDPSVFDFAFNREKQENGLYHITFTYSTRADDVSLPGFNYVYYQKTPDGILSVMFTCPGDDYSREISRIFRSVVPASQSAKEAPKR